MTCQDALAIFVVIIGSLYVGRFWIAEEWRKLQEKDDDHE